MVFIFQVKGLLLVGPRIGIDGLGVGLRPRISIDRAGISLKMCLTFGINSLGIGLKVGLKSRH